MDKNNLDKSRITIMSYDSGSDYYSRKYDRLGVRRKDVDLAFEFALGKRVLELGFGNGRDAEYISKKTDSYVGVDISEGLARIAKQKLPDLDLYVDDFRTLTFPPNSFDIVFSFASFVHLDKDELRNILLRIYDWLDVDGVLFISLKYGKYSEFTEDDGFGIRYMYVYESQDVIDLVSEKFEKVYEHFTEIGENKWFEIILKKK